MKKENPKKSNWSAIKKSLKDFDTNHFIELVKDLYHLSENNRNFLHARFIKEGDTLKRYKKIIFNALYQDVMDEDDSFEFEKAEKAIIHYEKATGDKRGVADLMIHYVECGNKYTIDYGDINESFYDALIEMYEKAVELVLKMPKGTQTPFQKRLKKIMESADGIGWGYHDGLCDSYYGAFE